MKKEIKILHALDQKWIPVHGIAGAWYIPINEDQKTGACTWLIKQDANGIFPEHDHPHWAEQMIIQGEITGPEGTFKVGSYQCLPPKVKHGPYKTGKKGMIGLLISEGPIW